jgi:hypothetical protein
MTDLLDLAIEAHGGLSRWRNVESINFRMTVGGGLWHIKGHPAGLKDVAVHLCAHRPEVAIKPFGDQAATGHFRPDSVWMETPFDGPTHTLSDPRASFDGHELTTPWTELQKLYFISYAVWNYMAIPFLLVEPGFETEELSEHQGHGVTWRRLRVSYPDHVPAHSREQTFYFSEDGLLRRLDYTVDIAQAPAAHYCFDHVQVGGLVIPTLRRAVNRSATAPNSDWSGPTGVLLQISDLVVR